MVSPLSAVSWLPRNGFRAQTFAQASILPGAVCDIDGEAVAHARREQAGPNLEFEVMDALSTSFPDASFDVVVCNQMYEHVPDPRRMMGEILRLLVPGGICYFAALNRLNVIEPHYGRVPFLSYLPKPLAHRYLQLLGRGGHYYETLYTYWGLNALCSDFRAIRPWRGSVPRTRWARWWDWCWFASSGRS